MHWKSLSPLKASLSVLLVTLPFSVLAASAERDDEVRPLEVASSSERPLRRPTVIQHPGKYVLRSDIHAEDTAIIIRASQVTLDLDGHFIWGPGGKKGVGIQVDGVSNVAVRKGTIGRFGTAVGVVNARSVRIEQLQLTGEDLGGSWSSTHAASSLKATSSSTLSWAFLSGVVGALETASLATSSPGARTDSWAFATTPPRPEDRPVPVATWSTTTASPAFAPGSA
jgi:hypothetical protein